MLLLPSSSDPVIGGLLELKLLLLRRLETVTDDGSSKVLSGAADAVDDDGPV